MNINAKGVFLGMKHAVPVMRKSGGGSIVNISSISGFVGQDKIHMGYNASKGAVRIMTKSGAVQYGRDGIRVNSVHPGFLPPMRTSKGSADPAWRKPLLDSVPAPPRRPDRGSGPRGPVPGLRRGLVHLRDRAGGGRRLSRRLMATRRIQGFCALCRSRCGCVSVVEDGRLVAVEPDPSHPTGASLCVKGRAAPELVYAEDRLLYPMRRTRPKSDPDAGWERISWDDALDWTAARMREVARRHGPEGVAFGCTTPAGTAVSDGFLWILRLIRAFGSPNLVWGEELCAWHRDFVTPFTFGVDIGTPDFDRTGCLLLWGHNPSATYLAQATAVSEMDGARGGADRGGPATGGGGGPCGSVAARAPRAPTARSRSGWPPS